MALAAAALALALRAALDPWLGVHAPLLLSVFPMIFAAWYGGVGPGLVAAAVGLVAGLYLFIEPRGVPSFASHVDGIRVAIFSAETALGAWLIGTRTVALRQTREARDLLEQRVRERTSLLEEANLRLRSFAFTVSHDLRAPLRGVLGLAHALEEDYGERLEPQAQRYLRHLVDSAGRMDALIVDLLALSRIEDLHVALEPHRLSDLLAEAQRALQDDLRESGAEVRIEHRDMRVLAARPLALQVLVNLLSNAVKFVPPETAPRIHVRAERLGRFIRVWIEDNGIGVRDADRERLFQPFERLNAEDRFPGTGIGLAIVRRAAERMRGRVGLAESSPQGSRFWFELEEAAA